MTETLKPQTTADMPLWHCWVMGLVACGIWFHLGYVLLEKCR